MWIPKKFFSLNKVEKKYVKAGAEFGDAVSYVYMGECVGFESLLNKWADWEREYSRRGFRTIALDDFVGLGGYGKSIGHLLRKKTEVGEEPIFHAEIYREKFLGKVGALVNINSFFDYGERVIKGNYVIPSTKEEVD